MNEAVTCLPFEVVNCCGSVSDGSNGVCQAAWKYSALARTSKVDGSSESKSLVILPWVFSDVH